MIRSCGLAFALLAMFCAGCSKNGKVTLYVSPGGSDSSSGSASSPLRTVEGARDRLRNMRAEGAVGDRPAEVVFEDGVYPVSETVVFCGRDSGLCSSPVVYRARNRGKAVFDGGVSLKWSALPADDPARKLLPPVALEKVLTAKVPGSAKLPGFTGGRCYANAYPFWLYADGYSLPIASYPDVARDWGKLHLEFARIRNDNALDAKNREKGEFSYFRIHSPRQALWAKEPDLWAYGLWCFLWDDSCVPVLEVDAESGVLKIDRKSHVYAPGPEGRCRIFNALSELDKPGEWAVDRSRRQLYYWPENASAPVLSSTPTLLEVSGASNLTFDGFVFCHSRADAVVIDSCTNVTLRGSCIRAVGGNGVVVCKGRNCSVVDSDLTHLGEGGVLLSGGNRDTLEPAGHLAYNNHVSYWGERLAFYRSAIGFGGRNIQSPGKVVGCRIEHNLMHHGKHLAVRLHGNDVTVAWNVIHDVCAATCDAGAVYGYTESDWTQARGSVVEHNLFHAIGHLGAGKMIYTIYNDGFLSGVAVRGNIVVSGDIGLFNQGGHANVYERNLVVCCTKAAHRSNLGLRHPSAKPDSKMWKNLQRERSLYLSEPWKSKYPLLAKQAAMTNVVLAQSTLFTSFKDNVFVCSGEPTIEDRDKLARWNVFEKNEKLKDPGFVDFAGFDWRLRPDSRAAAVLGDMRFENMGLRPSSSRYSPPVRFGAGVSPVPPLKTPLSAPVVRIDIERNGGVFTKENPMAADFVNCAIPDWSEKRTRVRSNAEDADCQGWQSYTMSFVPRVGGEYRIFLMGSRGRMTAVDDVKAQGAELANGGFESDSSWTLSQNPGALIDEPECALRGIVEGNSMVPAAEGRRVAVVNHDFILSQSVTLTPGVRFTLTWKARAWETEKREKLK